MYPIPIRHGLTVGELAQMIKGEGWIHEAEALDLTVIAMKNWQPKMFWQETGLTWIDPSPNIGGMNQATLYPGLCLLEATNVSEGRGQIMPLNGSVLILFRVRNWPKHSRL